LISLFLARLERMRAEARGLAGNCPPEAERVPLAGLFYSYEASGQQQG